MQAIIPSLIGHSIYKAFDKDDAPSENLMDTPAELEYARRDVMKGAQYENGRKLKTRNRAVNSSALGL